MNFILFKINFKRSAYFCKETHAQARQARQKELLKLHSVPFGAINPGHRYIFQDDYDCERKASGVVIEHGDEIIS